MTSPIENIESSARNIRSYFNPNEPPSDLGLRQKIVDYDPNIRDQVRRAYLQKHYYVVAVCSEFQLDLKMNCWFVNFSW